MGKLFLGCLIFCFTCHSFAQGQGNGNGNGNENPPGLDKKNSEFAKRPVVVSRDKDTSNNGKKPNKPNRPDDPGMSADVQARVNEFKEKREVYLEQKKELDQQVKEESKAAREALREQNKELLNQLKEQQKLWRQEAKERAKDLKKELHPDMGRVIDSGVGEGRER